MNGIDECDRLGHPSSGAADAGEMRAKAEYLMKIGMLLDTGQLGKLEAAQRLGLSAGEMDEILDGNVCDLTVAKIAGRSMASAPTAEDQAF
ncbi:MULTISPECIES: helix-turn-helix domain-containing protein [unclassified Pseudomonas]|uniref:helix-turn-helix domain-containing protein n=1 Tax=unclassified Pseudomonas TaxID=196821 RepID=UPI002113F2E0|nr:MULTISPECIES: helix-turn-helix domain-containing protein [unclassified Pseudomonas]